MEIETVKIGIDPGLSGAIALLENNRLSDLVDMPVMPLPGKRNQVNAAEVVKIIKLWANDSPPITAYLEQVSAMPQQGVSSMFGFGVSYGIIQGILASLEIPVILVNPQKWKRAAGLIRQPKDMARTIAQRLYPLAELSLKKHVGRADALLIARYGDQIK